MCTVTVITGEDGYLLGMNRDERLTRDHATLPQTAGLRDTVAIYPRDSGQGTWVAANDRGVALALLNWNDVRQPVTKLRSRGEVIPALIAHTNWAGVCSAMERLDLAGVSPFRLVGVFAEERVIREWRWDQLALHAISHAWQKKHWFSSSLSDASAEEGRSAICGAAWTEADAGSTTWLRRLHASHGSEPGPFSLCVHRPGVGTLSYTEIRVTHEKTEMGYAAGSPCRTRSPLLSFSLERLSCSSV